MVVLVGCGPPRVPSDGAASCLPAGAEPSAQADYPDVFVLQGRHYERSWGSREETDTPLAPDLVGPPVATVRCTLAGMRMPANFRLRDGDATYLPVGTALHEVRGYRREVRVAAQIGQGFRLYETRPS